MPPPSPSLAPTSPLGGPLVLYKEKTAAA
jgi:hypothetical protein